MIGAGMVELPRHDNTHLAQLTVEVHPAARRRGVGTELLAACERVAIDDGRRTVWGWDEQRLPAARGPTFAEARGYALVRDEVRRELSVPVDPRRARTLGAGALVRSGRYEVVSFISSWPDEWVEDRAYFGRLMSTEVPLGGWAGQEERWDRHRVRRQEGLVDRMGRELVVSVARHRASGRPVGFTELSVSRSVPEIAYQWDTLVLPEHRGHRLSLLVKLANLRLLRQISPSTTVVVTWNAEANGPMIAVNDALGYQVVSVGRTWQKAVA
ncbi:MAG TPA: GNAT family N-acetyltransferase, partial [Acidimicrobiales bacterium]|nr:GNAT family N-acetyltransferase [Acidimicrobiales bacterium]